MSVVRMVRSRLSDEKSVGGALVMDRRSTNLVLIPPAFPTRPALRTGPPDQRVWAFAPPWIPLCVKSSVTLGEMNMHCNVRPSMPEARTPAPVVPRGLTALCSGPGVTRRWDLAKTGRTGGRLQSALTEHPNTPLEGTMVHRYLAG